MSNLPSILKSSANPEKLSLTIKGIAVGLIPIAILIAGMFGLKLDSNELVALVDSFLAVLSAGMILFGLVRKLVLRFKSSE